MSKFSKLEGQDIVVESTLQDLRPVEEGWKLGVARILGALGIANVVTLPVGKALGLTDVETVANTLGKEGGAASLMKRLAAVDAAGFLAAFAGAKYIKLEASKELKKLFDNDKMKAYLKKECDAIFKELRKENSRITADISAYKNSKVFKKLANEDRSFIAKHLTQIAQCSIEVGGYTIVGTGDTDSFDQLFVVFFNPDDNKMIKKSIPVPSKEDLGIETPEKSE